MPTPEALSPGGRAWRYLTEKASDRQARRFHGRSDPEVAELLSPVSSAERHAALDDAIMACIARGATVEHRREFDAVLRYKPGVNHVVHAILSLLTFGLWLFVWLVLALRSGPVHSKISVDEFGLVIERRTA